MTKYQENIEAAKNGELYLLPEGFLDNAQDHRAFVDDVEMIAALWEKLPSGKDFAKQAIEICQCVLTDERPISHVVEFPETSVALVAEALEAAEWPRAKEFVDAANQMSSSSRTALRETLKNSPDLLAELSQKAKSSWENFKAKNPDIL